MIVHFTDDPLARLAVDETRRKSTKGPSLAAAHRHVGRILASEVAALAGLEECAIEHSTGASQGVQFIPGREPAIVAILRAGMFVAEGIWESLPNSALIPWTPGPQPFPEIPRGRPVILVDGVVNSGRTIRGLIEDLRDRELCVATLVAFRPSLEALSEEFPSVRFVAARLSERSYVGSGSTDTGARLFGTTTWESMHD